MREPENFENLVNLADIYILLKDSEKAETAIKKAESLQPDNTDLKRMRQHLSRVEAELVKS